MITYKDKTWCGNEECAKYNKCEKTYKFALKEAEDNGLDANTTSFSVCFYPKCDEYEVKVHRPV